MAAVLIRTVALLSRSSATGRNGTTISTIVPHVGHLADRPAKSDGASKF